MLLKFKELHLESGIIYHNAGSKANTGKDQKINLLNFQSVSLSQFTHSVSSSQIQNPLKVLIFSSLVPSRQDKRQHVLLMQSMFAC